jgi:hypothetical protein
MALLGLPFNRSEVRSIFAAMLGNGDDLVPELITISSGKHRSIPRCSCHISRLKERQVVSVEMPFGGFALAVEAV